MRAAEYWHREVRLDGITSHKRGARPDREKVRESKPGEWVVVLGGWSEEQFTDEPRGFTRRSLISIAPNNPVALQLFYFRVYANSAALKAWASTPTRPIQPRSRSRRTTRPTDRRAQRRPLDRPVALKLGEVAREKAVENARLLMLDLNKMGITAFQDQGGTGVKAEPHRGLSDGPRSGQMTVRSFYNYYEEPRSAADVENLIGTDGADQAVPGRRLVRPDWLR